MPTPLPYSLPRHAHRRVKLTIFVSVLALFLNPFLSSTTNAQTNTRYVNRAVVDGLISYWSFDENGGSTFRDSANLPAAGNDGQLFGGAGFFGSSDRAPLSNMYFNPSSLTFNGVTGIAEIYDAAILNPSDAFSLGLWIKRLADDGPGVIYLAGTNAEAWQFSFNAEGRLTFGAGGQVVATATAPLTINQWHYVAVTKQGTGPASVRLWLDGNEVAVGDAGLLAASAGNKYIGGQPGDPVSTWNGRVDQMSLYNRALTGPELQRLAAGSICATDGESWATAFRWLTCAIADSPANTEAWVARGLYVPGILRDHTFNIRNNVDLFGGFVGNETDRSQRPPFVAPSSVVVDPNQYTVLSGDVLGNDDPATFANYGDNNNHVLTGTGVALITRLDGFVIASGHADTVDPQFSIGGGLLNRGGRLTLTNLAFVANAARSGGGIAYKQTDLQLSNVSFLGNIAGADGGGLWSDGGDVQLSNTVFQANQAGDGGAVAIYNASLSVAGTQFTGNSAERLGGAIFAQSVPNLQLTNVAMTSNRAGSGGGLAAQASTGSIGQVQWNDNSADSGGAFFGLDSVMQVNVASFTANAARIGGALAQQGGSLAMTEVTLIGNRATEQAGAIYTQGGSVAVNRAGFYANHSDAAGGAIFNSGAATFNTVNADFVGNSAVQGSAIHSQNATFSLVNTTVSANSSSGGAAVSSDGNSNGSVSNTVIWGNTGAALQADTPSTIALNRNLLEGQGGSDPLFVRIPAAGDGDWSTLGNNDYGDLSVQISSPTIDAGDNAAVPIGITTDIKGSGRFWDHLGTPDTGAGTAPLVDIGAHEFVTSLPFAQANGPYNGTEGTPISVDAAGSRAQSGRIVAYEWDCESDGVFEVTGPNTTATCTYIDNGTYTLRLRVKTVGDSGEAGGSADATALVIVANAPPVYTPPLSQIAIIAADTLFTLGTFADAGAADKWQVVIDWGDGSRLDSIDVGRQGALQRSHIFGTAGQYTVSLRINDNDGGSTSGVFRVSTSNMDDDDDGDGRTNLEECPVNIGCPDTDGDGSPNHQDSDDDGDGLPSIDESSNDSDDDGIPDYLDSDDDGDGVPTINESTNDSDGDGIPDYLDSDDDGDGVPTADELGGDLDGDGIPDYLDTDDDGDGIPTLYENGGDDNANGVSDDREITYRLLLSLIRR